MDPQSTQVLATRSATDAAVGAAAAAGFIVIGLNFILRRDVYARKRQGLIGRHASSEARVTLVAISGGVVVLIGVVLLISFLAT